MKTFDPKVLPFDKRKTERILNKHFKKTQTKKPKPEKEKYASIGLSKILEMEKPDALRIKRIKQVVKQLAPEDKKSLVFGIIQEIMLRG